MEHSLICYFVNISIQTILLEVMIPITNFKNLLCLSQLHNGFQIFFVLSLYSMMFMSYNESVSNSLIFM
jgi:hypothetical protein